MTSLNMSSLDAALVQATLACDVAYIVELFQAECNCDMDPSRFVLSRGLYTTSVDMYRDILIIVNGLGIGAEILEMMPYIDDYLEYYFS
jgi:hypothetical protein